MKWLPKNWAIYYTKPQIKGIGLLIGIIFLLQLGIWYLKSKTINAEHAIIDKSKMAFYQQKIDSLRHISQENKYKITPFNPNYITDAKGQQLGMTLEQIDKLHKFRAKNQFVNSPSDFQKITGVSDDWMKKYAGYFKFPDWVMEKWGKQDTPNRNANYNKSLQLSTNNLNAATIEDLIQIKGIGKYLAKKIVEERNKYGQFVSFDELKSIKFLSPVAIAELKKHFSIKTKAIQKVNVQIASIDQLSKVPHITPYIARQIVILRSKQDAPLQLDDLKKINQFPQEKIKIIALYLDF